MKQKVNRLSPQRALLSTSPPNTGLSNVGNRGSGSNAAGFSKIQNLPDYHYDGLYRPTAADYDLGGGSTLAEAFDYDGERSERKRAATGKADMDVRGRPATCPR